MSTNSTQTTQISDLKPGDILTGFTDWECVPLRAKRKVQQDRQGRLFVRCRKGQHLLDGQEGDCGELVNCKVVA